MKVYLDNNIVCAIARDDTPQESTALDRLLETYDFGKVDLVTSELTLTEIKAYQGSSRPAIERTFRLLKKVPIVRWDELLGIHSYGDERTWINVPVIQNDPDYDKLLKLGLETVDAQHIFVAVKNKRDAFLTVTRAFCSAALPSEGHVVG
jgi:predicted nucleic acid-binding protein